MNRNRLQLGRIGLCDRKAGHPDRSAAQIYQELFTGDSIMNCKHTTCPLLEVSLIPLTQGKYAMVDIDDYDWLMQWKWFVRFHGKTVYAARFEPFFSDKKKRKRTIFMHRVILNTPNGLQSDHKNHNGIDNRACNLRTCTAAENCHNRLPSRKGSSRYKGVYFKTVLGKFGAQIMYKYINYHLGYRKSEIECAKLYDAKAKELFGEFAQTNF